MFYRFIVFFFGFILPAFTFGQPSNIIVQGVSPDLYVLHTVAPRENWYSLGRTFNLSPKDIAPVNGKTIATPLNIGDQIKVPLNATNFSQTNVKANDEVLVPVYHIVADKEWLFKISSNYNKVPVETLEKWNNIGKDGVKAGAKLIIGYLKVKKDQATVASNAGTQTPATQPATTPRTTSPPTTTPASTPPPVTTAPPVETKKPEPVQKPETKAPPVASTPPAENRQPQTTLPPGESYFKSLYEPAGKSASGAASVFRSVSGWQDKKYYVLMSNVNIGTVIRVTNPTNNKALYAKVLGQMPEMKESNGLIVRLSDAAAAELGTTAQKFNVQIAY